MMEGAYTGLLGSFVAPSLPAMQGEEGRGGPSVVSMWLSWPGPLSVMEPTAPGGQVRQH